MRGTRGWILDLGIEGERKKERVCELGGIYHAGSPVAIDEFDRFIRLCILCTKEKTCHTGGISLVR
jgi:hypothetical protein